MAYPLTLNVTDALLVTDKYCILLFVSYFNNFSVFRKKFLTLLFKPKTLFCFHACSFQTCHFALDGFMDLFIEKS